MNANSICKAVEVLNEISFSKFLKQVDGKNWRLHPTNREEWSILEVDDFRQQESIK